MLSRLGRDSQPTICSMAETGEAIQHLKSFLKKASPRTLEWTPDKDRHRVNCCRLLPLLQRSPLCKATLPKSRSLGLSSRIKKVCAPVVRVNPRLRLTMTARAGHNGQHRLP